MVEEKTFYDKKSLDTMWIRKVGMTEDNRKALLEMGIDIGSISDMESDEENLYLPMQIMVRSTDGVAKRESLFIIMRDDCVITIQETPHFAPFIAALRYIRRHPETLESSQTLLALILRVLNEQANKVIVAIGISLEDSSDDIATVTGSLDTDVEVGVTDISEIMIDLHAKEELISRCLESQLALARAARYLDAEVPEKDIETQALVRTLRADIKGVKEHVAFEHEKVRFLQNAILTSLNVKQNQIVKVFTIITAVFLPPTLIASLYGMNFAVMPELSWEHGFPAAIFLTLIVSLLPLWYIKYKGWLR